jgi:hypothetical protein
MKAAMKFPLNIHTDKDIKAEINKTTAVDLMNTRSWFFITKVTILQYF